MSTYEALLEHSHTCFCIVCAPFHTIKAELSSQDRGHIPYTAKIIDWPFTESLHDLGSRPLHQ